MAKTPELNMRELVGWQRKFQVWQYSVSHSVLLLRSTPTQEHPTRIDVAFSDVTVMRVRDSFASLLLSETTPEQAAAYASPDDIRRRNLYLINDGEGYVAAGNCAWHEDEGNHRTPSRFGPLRGTA
ncbi:hypothetical protein [Streptomyces triticirhizae]|uniref:Uncharacterized protein n=1 Tax=Streptomyces triticirhizae TaxID=2483353 RepID=A0A3M2LWW0_9ACTN|nr:hypothetical protein [Streptomyces triticirhizae]RMI42044.1 hypothetical protein EBN88_10005 [Streptomyces triticirhizae]